MLLSLTPNPLSIGPAAGCGERERDRDELTGAGEYEEEGEGAGAEEGRRVSTASSCSFSGMDIAGGPTAACVVARLVNATARLSEVENSADWMPQGPDNVDGRGRGGDGQEMEGDRGRGCLSEM